MEKIISVVPALVKKKFLGFSNETYTLIVTDTRCIFAHLSSSIMKKIAHDARADAKENGKGFFGQWGSQMAAALNYSQKYKTMNPEDILKENEKNFELSNSSIMNVKIRMYDDQSTARTHYDVIIKSTNGKFSYRTEQDPNIELKNGLGNKVK